MTFDDILNKAIVRTYTNYSKTYRSSIYLFM